MDFTFKKIEQRKKSTEKIKRWREKIRSNPERDEKFKQKERERKKLARQKQRKDAEDDLQKLEILRKQKREEVKRYRQRKKDRENKQISNSKNMYISKRKQLKQQLSKNRPSLDVVRVDETQQCNMCLRVLPRKSKKTKTRILNTDNHSRLWNKTVDRKESFLNTLMLVKPTEIKSEIQSDGEISSSVDIFKDDINTKMLPLTDARQSEDINSSIINIEREKMNKSMLPAFSDEENDRECFNIVKSKTNVEILPSNGEGQNDCKDSLKIDDIKEKLNMSMLPLVEEGQNEGEMSSICDAIQKKKNALLLPSAEERELDLILTCSTESSNEETINECISSPLEEIVADDNWTGENWTKLGDFSTLQCSAIRDLQNNHNCSLADNP